MKVSKRIKNIKQSVDTKKEYSLKDAIEVLKQTSKVKFVETLEVAMRLGVDPRHADQMIRGSVVLPHGTGKTRKLLVITKGENIQKALDAGADWAGFEEYIEKIKGGWFEMDVIVATPDVMAELGKIGKLLGPKGLMPNPKSGTVTTDVVKAVKEVKAGKIEFRVDKTGIIHAGVGRLNFETDKLVENAKELIRTVIKLKPQTAKGQYVKSVFVSSTMGPGLKIAREDLA